MPITVGLLAWAGLVVLFEAIDLIDIDVPLGPGLFPKKNQLTIDRHL